MIAQKMSENWGQPVVIENRTGAGGTIGAHIVAKATPDGHTLLVTSAAFAISAALHPNLSYDPLKDFAGVTRIGFATGALVVPPALGVRTVTELIELAQAKPNQLIFSHAGIGSSTHMNAERFRLAAGMKVKQVGFKGGADAIIEVIAGRVHFAIVGLTTTLPHIKDRKLVALAVNTPQRSTVLPDVPTIAETLPDFGRDGSTSMLAPAGTPPPVLHKTQQGGRTHPGAARHQGAAAELRLRRCAEYTARARQDTARRYRDLFRSGPARRPACQIGRNGERERPGECARAFALRRGSLDLFE